MTTPNQPAPDDLTSIIGDGAYVIGGGSGYGQNITDQHVDDMTKLPAINVLNPLDSLSAYLKRMPLDALKMFASLFGEDVQDNFNDVISAVDMIMNSLIPKLQNSVADLGSVFFKFLVGAASWDDMTAAWAAITDVLVDYNITSGQFWGGVISILVSPWVSEAFADQLSILIQVYFKRTQEKATQEDLEQALDDLLGTDPESWFWQMVLGSVRASSRVSNLLDVFFEFLFGSKTQAELSAAWEPVLGLFGLNTPMAIDDFWSNLFGKWWEGLFTAAGDFNRLIADVFILLDLFHLTYEVGSVGDAVDKLGTNGKRTWYSAWNDLMGLFGVSAVAAPDVKGKIEYAQDTADSAALVAGTANTNAGNAVITAGKSQDWIGDLLEDLFILLDVFHVNYPAGSPSDTKNSTVGGKRTYYAAWKHLAWLFGDVDGSTPPALAAVDDVKTKVDTAQSAAAAASVKVDTLSNAVVSGATGNMVAESDDESVKASVDGLRNTLVAVQQSVDDLSVAQQPPTGGIRFADNGAGSGGLGSGWLSTGAVSAVSRSEGGFHWTRSGSSSRDMWALRDAVVNADDMQSRVLFHSLPVQAWFDSDKAHSSSNWVIVRASSNFQNYVYARIYANRCLIGTVIGGVNTVRATVDVAAQSASSWEFRATGNVFVLAQNLHTIVSWTDTGNVAPKGSSYRLVGFGMSSYANSGGEIIPGDFSWSGQDLIPLSVKGSGLFASWKGTGSKSITGGNNTYNPLNSNFFDTVDVTSYDLYADTTNQLGTGTFIIAVQNEGFYNVAYNIQAVNGDIFDGFWRVASAMTFGAAGALRTIQGGTYQLFNAHGGTYNLHFSANLYLPANSFLQPRVMKSTGTWSLTGDSNGEGSWISVSKVG